MKRILKKLAIGLGLLVLTAVVIGAILHESKPKGEQGPEADALAEKMLLSLNYQQYKATRFLEWSFQGGAHTYKWDRLKKRVTVMWDDYEVDLDLISPLSSTVLKNGARLSGKEQEKVAEKALSYFNNDSFWLVAPYKVFDDGVERRIVPLENGTDGLLVTFTQGGDTPGDSYLWELQPSGFPKSFKMWVQIIPIGGIKATWEEWAVMESGAFLPKSHVMGPIKLSMGDIKGYN